MQDITNQIIANTGSLEENNNENEQEVVEETTQTEQHQQDEEVREVPQETPAQKSWRELERQAEEGKRAKKELEQAYALLRMIEEQKTAKNNQPPTPQDLEEEFNIDNLPDDEYTDNKQLKKILKQYRKDYQKLQKEMETNKKTTYQSQVESAIRQEFPDFREVVSHENVEKLKQLKPYIYRSLSSNPDLYEQAAAAYDAIKDFGIYKPKEFDRDKYQFDKNMSKPRAVATMPAQKKKSTLEDLSRYNNPSQEDLKALYEDAVKKSGRSIAYNS